MNTSLQTARFRLRPMAPDDLEVVHRALSDPQVTAHYGVHFDTLEETGTQMDWYAELVRSGRGIWWAVRPKDEEAVVGAIGFHDHDREHARAEIGFWVLPEQQRRGVMREVLPAVVDHAFGPMGLHRVEAEVEAENAASCRLLEAAGFVLEGVQRERERKRGAWIDLRLYARLAGDPPPSAT